jgi:hypothetical protein
MLQAEKWKRKLGLTESLTRMNWSTSMTGCALKAGALGCATMGTPGSGAALFLGGRGMVDGCRDSGDDFG